MKKYCVLIKQKFSVGFNYCRLGFERDTFFYSRTLPGFRDKLVMMIRDVKSTSLNICFNFSLLVYKLT